MVIKKFFKTEFNSNVLTLLTGTGIAQAIPVAISPILTRMYSPEDFGIFALFISISSILSVVSTGRYELAIMLPEKETEAINVFALSISIAFLFALLSFFPILIFNKKIAALLGNSEIAPWLIFVPFVLLVSGIFQSLNYWFNREKAFKKLSYSKVAQSGTTAITNIALGFGNFGVTGLILGGVAGQGAVNFSLGFRFLKDDNRILKKINPFTMRKVAYRYVSFLKYDVPATLCNTGAQQVPLALFGIFFNPAVAGFYYFTQRVLQMPINLLGKSILDVFKVEATSDFQKNGNARNIFKSTFYKLFLLSFPFALLLYFFIVDLFRLIFGNDWTIAGEYAQLLLPMLVLRFISSPLSFMIYIGEKQKLNLVMQFLLFCAVISSFFMGEGAKDVVSLISFSFFLFYFVQLLISAKIAKVF